MKKLLSGLLISCIAMCSITKTATAENAYIPLPPRLSLWGLSGEHLLAEGDAMLPIYGNTDSIFYADAQGKTTFATDWLGSLGVGVRSVTHNERILGAYLFADGNRSSADNLFWFMNPGIESLGKNWDFRANAYVPISSQQKYIGTGFADHFDNYNYLHFHGHTQWDAILQEYESVGWGVDAEAGRQIPGIPGLRWYVGGYHFNPENTSAINGISSRVEYPINAHLGVNMRDSYDNQRHNTLLLGVSLTLGGVNSAPRDAMQPIQNRLLEPVERHLATEGQANGEPVVTRQQVVASSVVERDNIWFFQPKGGSSFQDASSCTAEHPCSGFDQQTVNGINSIAPANPNFYFKPGQYHSETTSDQDTLPLALTNDGLFGRSSDYDRPLQSATFTGALALNGVDTLNSIILNNSKQNPFQSGLTLAEGCIVTLNHTQIGAIDGAQSYTAGVKMQDSTLYVTHDSEINAYSDSSNLATGIYAYGQNALITLKDSRVNVSASGANNNFSAIGIEAQGISSNRINLTDSQVNVNLDFNGRGSFSSHNTSGIDAEGDDNEITLAGNSSINLSGYISPDSKGHNEVDEFGIVTHGNVSHISLKDNAAVNVLADVEGGRSNTIYVNGISALQGVNTVNLMDHSSVMTMAHINNNATSNFDFVNGISVAGNNTVNLEDQSSIMVQGVIQDSKGFNTVKTQGINLDGFSTVNLSKNSRISANANADGNQPYAQAYGINSLWSQSVIHDADTSLSNINAYASAPGGEAVARKINGNCSPPLKKGVAGRKACGGI
ncbi:MAG TPA: inverse autotransporter beta domain-containing protein [Gammaproteobacteria bacterium]|nr:inverse autotransporter beta domain-containing protein [Gammaproteobacteria bacterium]